MENKAENQIPSGIAPTPNNLEETTAILLIGHGSRADGANEGQLQVAHDLKHSSRYLTVECAFLEITQPDIAGGLSVCQAAGASRIVVIPYFLHVGTHVRRDLPRIIGEWWSNHPEVEIVEGAPLGYSPRITSLVEDRIRQALSTQSSSEE